MTNLEKYNSIYGAFEISAEELPGLKYRSYAKMGFYGTYGIMFYS